MSTQSTDGLTQPSPTTRGTINRLYSFASLPQAINESESNYLLRTRIVARFTGTIVVKLNDGTNSYVTSKIQLKNLLDQGQIPLVLYDAILLNFGLA